MEICVWKMPLLKLNLQGIHQLYSNCFVIILALQDKFLCFQVLSRSTRIESSIRIESQIRHISSWKKFHVWWKIDFLGLIYNLTSIVPIGFKMFWQYTTNAFFFGSSLVTFIGRAQSKGVETDKTVAEKIAIFVWKKLLLKRNLKSECQFNVNFFVKILKIHDKYLLFHFHPYRQSHHNMGPKSRISVVERMVIFSYK